MINIIILLLFFSIDYVDEYNNDLAWHIWCITIMFCGLAPYYLTSKLDHILFKTIVIYSICDYIAYHILDWKILCQLCSMVTLVVLCGIISIPFHYDFFRFKNQGYPKWLMK